MKISIKSFVSAILTVVTITIVFSSCGKKADTVKHSDYDDFVITRTTDDWDLDTSFDSKTGEYYGSNGNYIIKLSGIAKTSIKERIKELESYGTNKIYDFMAPWKDVYSNNITPHKYVFSLSYYVAGEEQNITVVYDNYNNDKSPDRKVIDILEHIEDILYYEAESYKVTHNAAGEEIKNYDEIISYRIETNDFICDSTTGYYCSRWIDVKDKELTKCKILSYLYDFNISQYDESPIVKENEYFIVTVKTDKWEKTVSWTLDPTIPVDEGNILPYLDERFYNDVNYGKTRWVYWLEEIFGSNRLRRYQKLVMY